MFMTKENIENNLKKLKLGDKVVIVRRTAISSESNELCDYMEGTISSITTKTLILSFEKLPNKRVLKDSILSLTVKCF